MQPNDYLSDLEKTEVSRFNDNVVLKEAVRKVLLNGIYNTGVLKKGQKAEPLVNWALSFLGSNPNLTDEELGQELRGYHWGIQALESAFKKLEAIKVEVVVPVVKKKNKAL